MSLFGTFFLWGFWKNDTAIMTVVLAWIFVFRHKGQISEYQARTEAAKNMGQTVILKEKNAFFAKQIPVLFS